jgi:hypothetical protein
MSFSRYPKTAPDGAQNAQGNHLKSKQKGLENATKRSIPAVAVQTGQD